MYTAKEMAARTAKNREKTIEAEIVKLMELVENELAKAYATSNDCEIQIENLHVDPGTIDLARKILISNGYKFIMTQVGGGGHSITLIWG